MSIEAPVLWIKNGIEDLSVNENDIQANSGDSIAGYRMYFNGASFLDLGSDIKISDSSWSINWWFNADIVPGSLISMMSGEAPQINSICKYVGHHTSGKLAFWNNGTASWVLSNTVLVPKKWYNACWTYVGGSGTVSFYLNGESDGTGPIDTTYDDMYVRRFGVFTDGVTRDYTGFLDDIKYYDYTLTKDQVKIINERDRNFY